MLTIVRGTLFIDLDGTVLRSTDETPLPGAVDKINEAYDNGFMIVITTYRGNNYLAPHKYSVSETLQTLKVAGLKYTDIIWDSPSPRVVINDDVCGHIQHPKDADWSEYNFIE